MKYLATAIINASPNIATITPTIGLTINIVASINSNIPPTKPHDLR